MAFFFLYLFSSLLPFFPCTALFLSFCCNPVPSSLTAPPLLFLTACLLSRTAAEAWSTSTIRTRRQTRRRWCSPQRTTATARSATPSRTTPRPSTTSPQITTTSTPPRPLLSPPPPPLITTRSVSATVLHFVRLKATNLSWRKVVDKSYPQIIEC